MNRVIVTVGRSVPPQSTAASPSYEVGIAVSNEPNPRFLNALPPPFHFGDEAEPTKVNQTGRHWTTKLYTERLSRRLDYLFLTSEHAIEIWEMKRNAHPVIPHDPAVYNIIIDAIQLEDGRLTDVSTLIQFTNAGGRYQHTIMQDMVSPRSTSLMRFLLRRMAEEMAFTSNL